MSVYAEGEKETASIGYKHEMRTSQVRNKE